MTHAPRPDYLVGLMAVIMALGCAWTARRSGPFVPEASPLSVSEARGERVFMQHCQKCHPGGEAGLAPGLNDKPLPAALIALQVRQGFGAMPAFPPGTIDDAALTDLIDYLAALRERMPRPETVRRP